MDLFSLVAKLVMDTSEYDKGIKDSRGSITELAEHVSAKTVAMGNLIAEGVKKAISVIGDLGKTAVQNAADVAAESAQFEAAFGELQSAAKGSFESIGKETGILSTRLQNVGTKAFSQFKGAGLDAVNALSSMDKYTRLAADAAAYYDMSLEDADQLMRSFIRGNVSAGDRIGLFTSETQRNSKAMEMYGQKWTSLTEAQKQMLMLNVADEIYNQSGAIGQAAREADGWTNVTGNMQEAWRQFTAVLGKPFQEGLTPLIQKASEFLSDPVIQLRAQMVAQSLGELAGKAFDGVIDFIDTLLKWSNGEEEEDSTGAKVAKLAAALGDIAKLTFDALTSVLSDLFNTKNGAAIDNITEFLSDTVAFFSDPAVQNAASVIMEIAGAWLLLNAPIALVGMVLGVIVTHWKDIKTWCENAYNSVQTFFDSVWNDTLSPMLQPIKDLWEGVKNMAGNAMTAVSDFFTQQLDGTIVGDAINGISDAISTVIGYAQTAIDKVKELFGMDTSTVGASDFGEGKATKGNGAGRGFATGLDYVPYNNYRARLHEGEAVLTKAEATDWRRGNTGGGFDLSALTAAVSSGIREAFSGVAVNIDGQRAGDIMTDTISRNIAAQAHRLRYSV